MKLTVNGEVFEYEHKFSMAEAIALEDATGRRFAEWETELMAGSAKAAAGLVWLLWRRSGRDVSLADLTSGEVYIDYTELLRSTSENTETEEDPTPGAVNPAAPDGTATTPAGTRGSSRKSSESGRGRLSA